MLRGDLLLSRERFAEAADAYWSVIEVAPRSADAWAHRGRALAALGRRDEAAGAWREALAIDPGNAAAREALLGADAATPRDDSR
jgi:tetratricopeptide (TPR) repeat protein